MALSQLVSCTVARHFMLIAGAAPRFPIRLVAEVVGELDLDRCSASRLVSLVHQPAGPDDLLPGLHAASNSSMTTRELAANVIRRALKDPRTDAAIRKVRSR